jgi:hypothetical protein
MRERNGNSVPAMFRSEGQAQSWIKSRIAKGTIVNADEATSRDGPHDAFEMSFGDPAAAGAFTPDPAST